MFADHTPLTSRNDVCGQGPGMIPMTSKKTNRIRIYLNLILSLEKIKSSWHPHVIILPFSIHSEIQKTVSNRLTCSCENTRRLVISSTPLFRGYQCQEFGNIKLLPHIFLERSNYGAYFYRGTCQAPFRVKSVRQSVRSEISGQKIGQIVLKVSGYP